MYVESFKNNGIDYLRLVQSNRVKNSKGIKTARKKVIYNIGPLSKFDDGKPNYVERLKKSFKVGNPFIPSLKKYCDTSNVPIIHNFSIAEGSPDCFGNPKIFSNILIEKILEEIGIRNLFSSKPALKNNIDNLEFSRFILISDRGIFQYRNLLNILQAGNGYIVAKSLLKSTQKERDWTYDDKDYVKVSEDFKYKSRIVKRTIKDENNVKHTIEEKVVVYWSKKFQEKAKKENKSFLDFIKKLQDSPENFRLTALQNKNIRKFLKKDYINKRTGEILNSSEIKPMLDFEKINAYSKSLGYYQIVTSELNMEESEVIDKYHGLTQIEEQFRTMKSTLETRPLYVRTPEHIEAHLLICLIALIILRIIQKRIIASNQIPISEDMYWTTGINGNRIKDALNKWQVDLMPNELYRFMNIEDHDLQIILKAFEINIPKKLFTLGELKSLKTNIKVFI